MSTSIYLRDNSNATEEAIRDFLSNKLAAFKIPAVIKFSSEPLPKLASGKFDKPTLRGLFENK